MRISKVEFENFRLLEDENATISLDMDNTIIVGKNNCGKTSFTELFYKCFKKKGEGFVFEDFSLNTYEKFIKAFELYVKYQAIPIMKEKEKEEGWKEFIEIIPKIQLTIHIQYQEDDNLAVLNPFFVGLDEEETEVLIICQYICIDPEKLYSAIKEEINILPGNEKKVIAFIKENLNKYFRFKIISTNGKKNNFNNIKWEDIEDLFVTRFIYAQRGVDDMSESKNKSISKLCEVFFKLKTEDDESLTKQIKEALIDTENSWDDRYIEIFNGFFEDLKRFGYPSLNCYNMKLKSHFEADKLLMSNTTVLYQDEKEYSLPESYNGLGYSNLIHIMLQLTTFKQEYDKGNAIFMVLFIEEPEAHLHPQMQYTFIKNIKEYIQSKAWPVQIIITTHSAHIVAESEFTSIRYFDNTNGSIVVKDLHQFAEEHNEEGFLKQYMTLKYCEMFFSDKIIMIEGTVERLLLPHMLGKCDRNNGTNLMQQYISVIEVGGAYAHKFKELIKFINLKTLIITDIDAIDTANNRSKCRVEDGDQTSNQTLCQWLPAEADLNKLLMLESGRKIYGKVRVTYQIPEDEAQSCGRSFEEAFILRNPNVFIDKKDSIQSITTKVLNQYNVSKEIRENSYKIAAAINKKTDFAFDMITVGIENWYIPKYIEEGLIWLAE